MNILYTLNDKFVPQVAASITSICENNKNTKDVTFYLMSLKISKDNKKNLKKYIESYNRNVVIIELSDLEKFFDFKFDTKGWNPIVLARLLLDKLLPNDVSKILYLDGDTIVRGSLEKLWNINMGKCAIGASIEPTIDRKRIKILNMDEYPYYNAGVLLVNLDNWRKNKIGDRIIDFYKCKDGNLFANDQDAINGSQKGKIYTLSPKYNYYNIFDQYSYKFMKKLMGKIDYIDKNIYLDANKNPVIIHYLGEERPWRIGNKHKYREDYVKYLNMSPWKGENFEEGWSLYFKCWSIFNVVTKPFPLIRYKIINKLIPTFMKYRTKKLKKEIK